MRERWSEGWYERIIAGYLSTPMKVILQIMSQPSCAAYLHLLPFFQEGSPASDQSDIWLKLLLIKVTHEDWSQWHMFHCSWFSPWCRHERIQWPNRVLLSVPQQPNPVQNHWSQLQQPGNFCQNGGGGGDCMGEKGYILSLLALQQSRFRLLLFWTSKTNMK